MPASTRRSRHPRALAALFLLTGAAFGGDEYEVVIRGSESATLRFEVDEDVFVDSLIHTYRGYVIDESSFELAFDSLTVGLDDPLAGTDARFVLRDEGADSFFVSKSVDDPGGGVLLDVDGVFGPIDHGLVLAGSSSILSSLDVDDAVGVYTPADLVLALWSLDDFMDQLVIVSFEQLPITPILTGSTGVYGCGVNPAGSISVAGSPTLGSTLSFGVDNPFGTQAPGSLPFLYLSLAPSSGYPCGLLLAGYGMAGPGATGELLVSLTGASALLLGPPWSGAGSPAVIDVHSTGT